MILEGIFVALLGVICGIFVNYLADVLPIHRDLRWPFCLNCNARYRLGNYFFWPKRCPQCNSPRTLRTWFIEALSMFLCLWLWKNPTEHGSIFVDLPVLSYFLLVIVIDVEHRLVLHQTSVFGTLIGLGFGILIHGFIPTLAGGIAGFAIMLIFYFLGIVFVRILNKIRNPITEETEGICFGDVILAGIIGLYLGWPGILLGLLFALLMGGAISLIYMLISTFMRKFRWGSTIPYAPFLILSAVLLLFFKNLF